jgi:hypothetical protein
MKRILLSSLVLLSFGFATGAQAGKPITGTVIESDHIYPWEMQRINATEWTESGDATKAFRWQFSQVISGGGPLILAVGIIALKISPATLTEVA